MKNILIKDDAIGDRGLGDKLLYKFLNTLKEKESQKLPKAIFLMNRAVFLSTTYEKYVEILQKLEAKGVEIYTCHTCLDFLGLLDNVRVGKVGNMSEMIDTLLSDGETISF